MPTITKGEKLSKQAEKYLESQGFEHADLSMYFLLGQDDRPGIGLAYPDHAVSICYITPTFDRSPWIEAPTKKIMVQVLDLLIFAVKSVPPKYPVYSPGQLIV